MPRARKTEATEETVVTEQPKTRKPRTVSPLVAAIRRYEKAQKDYDKVAAKAAKVQDIIDAEAAASAELADAKEALTTLL